MADGGWQVADGAWPMADGGWRMDNKKGDTEMPFRFESLKIWHMARAYSKTVTEMTAKFPRKEDYVLSSQMRRAAHSIVLNIAEGSAKKSPKHFDLFLDNAVGSTFEVVSGGFQALDQNYITQADHDLLYREGEVLAKSINAFRRTLGPA